MLGSGGDWTGSKVLSEKVVMKPYSVEMNVLASKSKKGKSEYQSLSPEAAQIRG